MDYSKIQNIIFDLDGVLVDSRQLHYDSLNQSLKEVGEKYVIGLDEHLAKYDGCSTRIKLQLLTKEKGLPEALHQQIWARKQEITIDLLRRQIVPDTKITFILESLKQYGYKLYCASNSISDTLETTLSQLGISDYFIKTYSNETVLPWTKPHPKIYLKCMEENNLIPQQTLIIEDSPIGRLSAQLSGAHLCPVISAKHLTLSHIMEYVHRYEDKNKQVKFQTGWLSSVQVVIPMAGRGSRFANVGFKQPKPLIDIKGKPMISYVIDNLKVEGAKFIFIVQEEHMNNPDYHLKEILDKYVPNKNYIIVPTSTVTEGPACSVLLTEKYLDPDVPLLVANSDQFLEWDINSFLYQSEYVDGSISVFHQPNSNDTKWSYAKLDGNGMVVEVKEKQVISDLATTGIYYWKKAGEFIKYSKQMIKENDRVNNEFYVCPVYNYAIRDEKKIKVFMCSKMWGLGVPSDLEYFIKHYNL